MPRSRVGIFHNKRIRSTPLHRKLMFWSVSYYLGAFGTVWLPYETRCKTGRSSAKVCATKSRRNFSQRTHRIPPLHRKLTFWCVSHYLGAFGTVWLPYETRCKTGRARAKVCATKSSRNFSHRTHPIHPIGPFGMFGYLTKLGIFRTELIRSTPLDRSLNKVTSEFFATNAPDPPHWTLN